MSEEKPNTGKAKQDDKKQDNNIVFIGGKPFMNYINSVQIQFRQKNSNEVIVKARGKFISRAVDVADSSVKKFLSDLKIQVKDIKIDSEGFKNKEGRDVNVSTIEITLSK